VYNLSQQCSLEHELQEATSSFKMRDAISSNSISHPEFFGNQIKVLKPVPPSKKIRLAEPPEIKTPVTSTCISLTKNSNTHDSNLDNSINTSQCILIDNHKPKDFMLEDNGFIFEISKRVELPNSTWKIVHINAHNETSFYKLDNSKIIFKEINFCNSFVPTIKMYTKNYNFNSPITSKNQLKDLLEQIDKF